MNHLARAAMSALICALLIAAGVALAGDSFFTAWWLVGLAALITALRDDALRASF